jgi:formylglycine-generating enzyme required for sulfatase activity
MSFNLYNEKFLLFFQREIHMNIITEPVITTEFALIPAGTFLMGSPENENGRSDDETQHQVTLTRDFYMQTTPVTQRQWKIIMEKNPSCFNDGDSSHDNPVENVSWYDCQEFIDKLNQQSKNQYRLPTEAEWEYACRAGSTTAFSFGEYLNDENQINAMSFLEYFNNSNEKTTPVKTYQPNAFGLYDMHGNVWEWCLDHYNENAYKKKQPDNPVCVNNKLFDIYQIAVYYNPIYKSSSPDRVIRGGGWDNLADRCRSALRFFSSPAIRDGDLGFRLLRIV